MSFKGFANRLSHDCRIDIDRNVSTAYRRSSSVSNSSRTEENCTNGEPDSFLELSFWPLKLTTNPVNIWLNFT